MTFPKITAKKTGSIRVVDGHKFETWHIGIQQYEYRSPDLRIAIRSAYNKMTYSASVDGEYIRSKGHGDRTRKFRSFQTAARAALEMATP